MQAGVEAEWIGIKKDLLEAEERAREKERERKSSKAKGKVKGLGGKLKGDGHEQENTTAEPTDDGMEGECGY